MGIDPQSPRCDRFYAALAAANLPIISHAGRELAVAGGNQDFGNPLRLRHALDHGVRVVLAHCASDGDDRMADLGLLDRAAVPWLQQIRAHNPLLFDFALKRLLRHDQSAFPASVFETRRFFESQTA